MSRYPSGSRRYWRKVANCEFIFVGDGEEERCSMNWNKHCRRRLRGMEVSGSACRRSFYRGYLPKPSGLSSICWGVLLNWRSPTACEIFAGAKLTGAAILPTRERKRLTGLANSPCASCSTTPFVRKGTPTLPRANVPSRSTPERTPIIWMGPKTFRSNRNFCYHSAP